jgi:hypothetical protein
LSKATLANLGAFIIVVAGLALTVYHQKWELAGSIIGAGIGYLFKGKQS